MAREAYPTGNDVAVLLQQAGLITTGLNVAAAAERGRIVLEQETDRQFLAATATREYDPPVTNSGVLDLRTDLLSLSAITYQGAAFVVGTDYRLLPRNAPGDGRPYTQIGFLRRWTSPLPFSLFGALSLTGQWGYAERIPESAWQGMLAAAAISLLPQISFLLRGGLLRWTDADVTEQYSERPLAGLEDGWGMIRDEARRNYRRVTVG